MQDHNSNSIRRSLSLTPPMALRVAGAAAIILTSVASAQLADPADTSEPAPAIQPVPEPPPAAVADPVDPSLRAKLRLTIDAYAQAKSLSFRSKSSYTGFLDGKSPSTQATVRMTRPADNPTGWLIQATGTGKRKPTDSEIDFNAVWGPTSISWLDTATKKLMERPSGQGRGPIVQMAAGTVPTQITERVPFSKESIAESITLDSADPIGGVACELLTVRPKGKHGAIKLWIGTDDHLLRKVERVSESASYGSSSIIEMTDLKLDEEIAPDSLRVELPEGYERDSVVIPSPSSEGNESGIAPKRPARPAAPSDSTATPASPEDSTARAVVPLSNTAPETTQPTRPDAPSTPNMPPLPAFSAVASNGTKITHETIRGQPAVLFFFGTWSIASRAAEPELFKALDEAKSAGQPAPQPTVPAAGGSVPETKVYAFAVRERSKEAGPEFMASTSHTATVIPRGDDPARALGVRVFPTFVVVNAEGFIQTRIEGFRRETTPTELANALKVLAGLKPADTAQPASGEGATSPQPLSGSTSEAAEAQTQGQ